MEPETIARIARAYHDIRRELANLDRSGFEGPNAKAAELSSAARLLTELIPAYRETVPDEVQDLLSIDIDELEERCQRYDLSLPRYVTLWQR